MFALTYDVPVAVDVNTVHSLEQEGTRGRDQRRSSNTHVAKPGGDASFGVRIDRRSGVDQNQYLGITKKRSREAESLTLTTRETSSAFFDFGAQTVVECVENVGRARRL